MKKQLVSLLLALVMCLGLLPFPASAAETNLPDWYFLFAIFKNVDADAKDKDGKPGHVEHSMPQDEIDFARAEARDFEEYMNSVGVMRAHVEVVEIDAAVTELDESNYGSWLSPKEAAPILQDRVDLDQYDHVVCYVSLKDLSVSWLGLTGDTFENGTGMSCINLNNRKWNEKFPSSAEVHEFLHFGEHLTRKWGGEFVLHRDGKTHYTDKDGWKAYYTDAILNRINEPDVFPEGGTGVHPAAWQYPPHVLRAMTELNVPTGVTGIGVWAFGHCTNLTRVFIPTSVKSVEYAAFWDTGVKDVYYAGTEAQWKAIQTGEYNKALTGANIHYNHLLADVKTTDPFAPSIAWALERGITGGTGGGRFSPGSPCTQAQILTFLWRAKGSPAPDGAAGGNEYYASAVQWAREQGLIDGTFSPAAPCTRAMAVAYLWKLAGSPKAKAASFSDVPAGADWAKAVDWAVEQGVTAGTSDTTFSPDNICTRGQIVTFLYRTLTRI